MSITRNANVVRESVSRAYASAVEAPVSSGGGCCGGSSCCGAGAVEQKGVAVQSAGYHRSQLADLPADAVVNSFGCGNPLAFADVKEGETVLDLGSGAGIDLLIAAKKVGPRGRVIGVDMTEAMIARARANIAAAGAGNVEVRQGIIENLPVDSASVDWVISNCVINLSPEKDRVFAEIARVLKPGGRISVSDIVVESLPDELRRDERIYASCIGGAIRERDYADGLRRAGLTDVAVSERHVYDAGQLEGIIESELPDSGGQAASLCGCSLDAAAARRLGEAAAGKVWSARFSARKPVHAASPKP
jgi:arsenite methyltransferase